MTCREFKEIVHGLVRLELLDVSLREEALEHARTCGNCAARMAGVQALGELVEAAGEDGRGEETPERVEMALLAAFRRERQRRRGWRRALEWAAVGVAAAGLLVAAWFSYGMWKAEIPHGQGTGAVGSAVGIGAGTQPANWEGSDADLMADFVPVPFGDGIEPDVPAMVVRVELTRAALGVLGYPVDKANAAQVVRADVLVGEDGWPRAVRLVQ